ncbi:MAG: HlyD family efflux transporter periplasmic adaptor subunit [Proteobacteria bacterium]|nr:HlyD family efflux transporter periplasmic adaptor subunit [Pseudomonadota bacterium]
MSLDKQDGLAKITQYIPDPIRSRVAALKAQFLAAKKSTRIAIAGSTALVLVLLITLAGGYSDSTSGSITFKARRGQLDITVLEGGALEALRSQEIRSQVKGREGTKILNIVEEGYRVTPGDVDAGLILVELDKAQLIDEQLNQEIAVETAEASYIERRAQLEIQLNQNMTDLNDARQEMRFARLDFEKFLGGNIVRNIISQLDIEGRLARAEKADLAATVASVDEAVKKISKEVVAPARPAFDLTDLDSMPAPMRERIEQMLTENGGELPPEMLERMQQFGQGGFGGGQRGDRGPGSGQRRGESIAASPVEAADARARAPAPELKLEPLVPETPEFVSQLLMDDSYMTIRDTLDFTQYADMEILEDGEAKQQLRGLQDELQVSQEEHLLAQDRIEGQRRLEARGFITPTELEAEELNLSKARNKEAEKETALKLYIQYSFPKDAEEKLSEYENAVMGYQRQLMENVAERAQEEARFSSAERKYNLERVKLADVEQQIELATIRATTPGLVVYGAADQNSMRYRGGSSQEAIQEGATVRERQAILTIPDLREMAIKVNIHESVVQRVAVGQSVKVSIDAFPDEKLTGVVTKVAVVADSANAFMNPDLKVYPTTIKIDGTQEWLRPGMSAEVEILVDRLDDVVYVPVQAVTYFDDKRVVYVSNAGRPQRREVEIGAFSESFIVIRSGIEEGEEVMLLPPQQNLRETGA